MQSRDRVQEAVDRARGRWLEVFAAAGIPASHFTKPNRPCPLCGGRDRFTFDDRRGRGDYFCRQCGPGDGFALLQKFCGITFGQALEMVERRFGIERPAEPAFSAGRAEILFSEGQPLTGDDAVSRYLLARGLPSEIVRDPDCTGELRLLPELAFWEEGQDAPQTYAAMLARVSGAEGEFLNVHRTYLQGDRKADVASPRKLMKGPARGGFVALGAPGPVLGFAEGIETALAARALFGIPVWAAVSAGNLAAIERLPAHVRAVVVFADHDASRTGQRAACGAAHRLLGRGIPAEVWIPGRGGEDFLDVWNAREAGIDCRRLWPAGVLAGPAPVRPEAGAASW